MSGPVAIIHGHPREGGDCSVDGQEVIATTRGRRGYCAGAGL